MKKRKSFLAMALVVALLVLGVGYAAISDIYLTINGTATASPVDSDFDVHFTGNNTTYPTDSDDVTITNSFDEDNKDDDDYYLVASMNVEGLSTDNTTATSTFEIENASDLLGASLSVAVYDSTGDEVYSSDYFTVEATLDVSSLAAGEKTNVNVVVTYNGGAIDEIETSFTVVVTAEATSSTDGSGTQS